MEKKMYGWICPKCGSVLSPWKERCDCTQYCVCGSKENSMCSCSTTEDCDSSSSTSNWTAATQAQDLVSSLLEVLG